MITYEGFVTSYDPSLAKSACGPTYSIFDNVTRISAPFFDSYLTEGNRSNISCCGHGIQATTSFGSVNLTVVDVCKCTGLKQPFDKNWRINQ